MEADPMLVDINTAENSSNVIVEEIKKEKSTICDKSTANNVLLTTKSAELGLAWLQCRYLLHELLLLILKLFIAIFTFILERLKNKNLFQEDLISLRKYIFSSLHLRPSETPSTPFDRSSEVLKEKFSIESQVSMCELLLPSQVDPRGNLLYANGSFIIK